MLEEAIGFCFSPWIKSGELEFWLEICQKCKICVARTQFVVIAAQRLEVRISLVAVPFDCCIERAMVFVEASGFSPYWGLTPIPLGLGCLLPMCVSGYHGYSAGRGVDLAGGAPGGG
ncbi:hedgehog [Dorcoceras hygrometricum]|uniref:Hedgehog n=1 Tax=Dorcoceras hygrometricum TaxID=472368 RepID=A0A2Z7BDE4_9LAMI|nr:hedgehog [Dorcoceras hygrometricum]